MYILFHIVLRLIWNNQPWNCFILDGYICSVTLKGNDGTLFITLQRLCCSCRFPASGISARC